MAKPFVLHDETVNTYGFRMLTSGCDLTEFKKNPVMLLNHNDWSLPIGRWENIRIEGTRIVADPVFDLNDLRENGGKAISNKVENDFLRMASIGAWPPEEVSDDPIYKLQGQTQPTVLRWKAREASIVTIGSNHNALAFYDHEGELIDLTNSDALIQLIDNPTIINNSMNELNQILKLSDTATMAEQATAVRSLIGDRDRLKSENVTLSNRIEELNKAEKKKQTAEAISLIDTAVKEGRIDAKGKESFIKLFDTDFESAKSTLAAIPVRKSVTEQIAQSDKDAVLLADLKGLSWDELDKQGHLTMLKDKHFDVYAEKFEAKFKTKPQKA